MIKSVKLRLISARSEQKKLRPTHPHPKNDIYKCAFPWSKLDLVLHSRAEVL